MNRVHHSAGKPRKPGRAAVLRAAVWLALAFGAVACSTPDPRTEEERAADQAIAGQVRGALLADANLYANHIDVNARRGVVWLTGWVTSSEESRAAVRDSETVPGVQRVVDQIEVVDWSVHY